MIGIETLLSIGEIMETLLGEIRLKLMNFLMLHVGVSQGLGTRLVTRVTSRLACDSLICHVHVVRGFVCMKDEKLASASAESLGLVLSVGMSKKFTDSVIN